MNLFQTEPLVRAKYLNRPNRFTIQFRKGSETGYAYLANPGRLEEILLPGIDVLLATRTSGRFAWEALGATWKERWPGDSSRLIVLNDHVSNKLAARLIERQLLPEIQGYRVFRKRYKAGNSHPDLLLSNGHQFYLLGVKSVVSCEEGLAYFPDSKTRCGGRHLEELANNSSGYKSGVLFLAQNSADHFLPDFHNDLEFARTFLSLTNRLDLLTYSLNPVLTPDERVAFTEFPRPLTIPWRALKQGIDDGGVYLLLLELEEDKRIKVGVRAELHFAAGWYLYSGSAKRYLSKRLDRHLRFRKRLHWHVDFLRAVSSKARAFPVRGTEVTECSLAEEIQKISAGSIDGFGCSDCRCNSHIFYFPDSPIFTPSFQRLLTRVRRRVLK